MIADVQILSATKNVISKVPLHFKESEIEETVGTVNDVLNVQLAFLNLKSVNELGEIIYQNSLCNSMGFFIVTLFKDVNLNWHHIEWIQLAECRVRQKICLEAARDLGKTFFFTELFFCWKIYSFDRDSKIEHRQQGSGLIFSQNQRMAKKKLKSIKSRIATNKILAAKCMPDSDSVNTVWAKESIVTKNGYELDSMGIDSGSRGYHVYHIVLDDILMKNALYSADYRESLHNTFFADIEPQLKENEGGKLIMIGTPLHNQDLYNFIKTNLRKNYTYREYPAIFPDGRICWLWKQSEKFLKDKIITQGSLIFAQEFLCRPISDASSIFPYKFLVNSRDYTRSYVNCIEDFDLWDDVLYVVSGSDFAKSASAAADDSVHIVYAVTTKRDVYCLYIFVKKGMSYFEQLGVLRNIDFLFRPNKMGLESNGFQKIFEENYKEEYSFSTVKGYVTGRNKNDYQFGLPSLSILFEREKIHYPYKTEQDRKITDMILAQFNSISFTDHGLKAVSGHDDIPFASYIAKQAIDEVDREFSYNIFSQNE